MKRFTISPTQAAVIRSLLARGIQAGQQVDPDEVFPADKRKAHSLRALGRYFGTYVWNLDTSFKGILITETMLQAEAGDKVDGGHRGRRAVLHKRQPTALERAQAQIEAVWCTSTDPKRTTLEWVLDVIRREGGQTA